MMNQQEDVKYVSIKNQSPAGSRLTFSRKRNNPPLLNDDDGFGGEVDSSS